MVSAVSWRGGPGGVAKICKIPMRALSHLEYGDGNPTLKTLESVFKVFGMRISLAMVAGPVDTPPPTTP